MDAPERHPNPGSAPGDSALLGEIRGRIETRNERVHINLGAVCNNNCIFCMEEDRDLRYVVNSAMTPERVRWILEEHRGGEEVCFTSGEPTTNENLPEYVRWATKLRFRRRAVMTNGRRLAYRPYLLKLAKAGMNRFSISIHGHTKKLHEGLTRTPDSFEQTSAGMKAVAKLKPAGVELHTSTVITKRNLPYMSEIYSYLRESGVDQVVFNVMQANGRANTYFDQIFPTYTEIAAQFRTMLAKSNERETMAFLVDIPLCTTEGVADFNRGYVERYRHFEPTDEALMDVAKTDDRKAKDKRGRGLSLITRGDLDEHMRDKRPECQSCIYEPVCEGVWRNYHRRMGWDEFVPITERRQEPAAE